MLYIITSCYVVHSIYYVIHRFPVCNKFKHFSKNFQVHFQAFPAPWHVCTPNGYFTSSSTRTNRKSRGNLHIWVNKYYAAFKWNLRFRTQEVVYTISLAFEWISCENTTARREQHGRQNCWHLEANSLARQGVGNVMQEAWSQNETMRLLGISTVLRQDYKIAKKTICCIYLQ